MFRFAKLRFHSSIPFKEPRVGLVGLKSGWNVESTVSQLPSSKNDITSQWSNATKASIGKQLEKYGFQGKEGEIRIINDMDVAGLPSTIAFVGLSRKNNAGLETCVNLEKEFNRLSMASAVRFLSLYFTEKSLSIVAYPLNGDAQSTAEGALLSQWTFDKLKSESNTGKKVKFEMANVDNFKAQWEKGVIYAKAQNYARTLAESPANLMTPTLFVEFAKSILKENEQLKIHVGDRVWIEKESMGAFLSVSRGSEEEPCFLEIEYDGTPKGSDKKIVALVGKGVTFDSGGISIKPSKDMAMMKGDMMGASVTLATLWAIQKLKLPIKVVAAIPLTENMPSGKATKPGDVVLARNGKSIEVDNTDAEGRLILADAIHYICEKYSPTTCIELSTLTGAMDVALGYHYTGAFCSTTDLWEKLSISGYEAGDPFWRMPFHSKYLKQMKSNVADLKNAGGGSAGSCTAAAFLTEFVPSLKSTNTNNSSGTEFAHLDIAGVMNSRTPEGYLSAGMTGRPTRSLIEYLSSLKDE